MLKIPIISEGKDKTLLFSHFNTPAEPGVWKKENLIFPENLKINVFVEGEFNVFSDEKNHRPVYGEICAFSPLKMHYGHITKHTHLNYYQFDVGVSSFDGIPHGSTIISELIENVRNGESFATPNPEDRVQIYRLCEEVEKYLQEGNIPFAYIRCFEFILLLHRIYSVKERKVSDSLSYHVRCAIKYMESNFGENITVQLLANNQNISEGYLARCFKKETGMTVHQYLNRYRLLKSAELLKNHSVAEVCFMCGFCDSSHFITVFKKHMGCTPMKFKANNKT